MYPSSEYDVVQIPFNEADETQGSKLTVENPTTDDTFTCRTQETGQKATDTDVQVDIYGTYLYCLNHLNYFIW